MNDDGTPKATGGPAYVGAESRALKVSDHFTLNHDVQTVDDLSGTVLDDKSNIVKDKLNHFINDPNDPLLQDIPSYTVDEHGVKYPKFSGSVTNINPLNDPTIKNIVTNGLDSYEKGLVVEDSGDPNAQPPLSPIEPFVRTDPFVAQQAMLTVYNRTKAPMSDVEFRKGFRHIFFNRPECYIMSHPVNGVGAILSEQAEHDEEFSSCYSRMPYVLKLLSPIYVTGSFAQNGINSNWNYLLSNRVISMSGTPGTTMSTVESITTGIEGYTVTPPMNIESDRGSTLTIRFRDSKTLEVYTFLQMWMRYMYKRARGIFSPPYNGYQYRNGFLTANETGTPVGGSVIYHPYDRAEEYMASIFDIYTNEADAKILHWCKYYGVYPTEATVDGLTSETAGAVGTDGVTVSATFKYHRKLECSNMTLVEFNYNAGITDDLGQVTKEALSISQPFLLKDDQTKKVLKQYIGSAGMFTGSPYIILGKSQNGPLQGDGDLITPYLQFMGIKDGMLNSLMNMGLTNIVKSDTGNAIGTINDGTTTQSNSSSTTASGVVKPVLSTLLNERSE